MKLKYAVHAAEQLFHVVVWQERFAPQRLQVTMNQIHQILRQRSAVMYYYTSCTLTTAINKYSMISGHKETNKTALNYRDAHFYNISYYTKH